MKSRMGGDTTGRCSVVGSMAKVGTSKQERLGNSTIGSNRRNKIRVVDLIPCNSVRQPTPNWGFWDVYIVEIKVYTYQYARPKIVCKI